MFEFGKSLPSLVVIITVFLAFLIFPLDTYAFNSFGTVTVVADFAVNGEGSNIDTIAFWEAPHFGDSLMFVTSKSANLVEVWQYPFNTSSRQHAALRHSCINSGSNGVIVDQQTDKLYVSVRYSTNVCVFNLPDLSFDKTIKNSANFKSEPNLALMNLPNNSKRLFVSDDYDVFVFDPASGSRINTFRPIKGLEAMYADDHDQILYIPDEGGRSGVYAYDPNGSSVYKNNKNYFGDSNIFNSDAEGIFIYKCSEQNDDGNGLIVVSDQIASSSTGNDYEVFDRKTWQYLGKFKVKLSSGNYVYNTDGIALIQQSSTLYPKGLFAAIQSDTSTVGVSWQKILNATNLSCSGSGSTPTAVPTSTSTPTPRPTTTPTPTPSTPGSSTNLTAVQDATVQESSSGSNYGNNTSLVASDYSATNSRLAYLQFDLGSLAGIQLKSVQLKITPTLSRKVNKVVRIVNDPWSEQTLTWNNRPALNDQVGQLIQSVSSGQEVVINLDPSLVQSYAGSMFSIALDNTGTQNTLEFSSKEGSFAPTLVITTEGPLSTDISGDVNNDGIVNILDYQLIISLFGSDSADADFNNNGVVDLLDFNVVISALTVDSSPTPVPTQTPTPTTRPTSTPTPVPTVPPSSPTPAPTPPGSIVYRAFKNDSYWNVPMPLNAPIDPNNSTYINDAKNSSVSTSFLRIAGAPDHSAGYDWSYPIYWAKSTDPLYTISPSSGRTIQARIPRGATPQGGSDGGIIIYDITGNQVVEMWQASYNSSTDTWSASSTKRYMLDSNGLDSSVTGSDEPLNFGHRGVATPARAIRLDEVASGRIQHRLECFWHATYPQHYWPMSGHESGKGGITPEGLVLRLKPSVDINNRGLSSAEKVIAKAMQEYGCIIGDNEGGTANSVKLERGPDDWADLDPNMSLNAFNVFTWDNYEFIRGGYDPVSGNIIQ